MTTSHVTCVTYQKEKKTLDTLRLDLDAAKTKLRRAKSQPGKETVSMFQCRSVIVVVVVDVVVIVVVDDSSWFEF